MEVLFLIISTMITYIILPYIKDMLIDAKILAKNYRGENIPIAMGITFIPVITINFLIVLLFYKEQQLIILTFLLATSMMAFLGIIDDLIGNRRASGFKGHISSFFKGKMTTGFLKALVGGIVSLIISFSYSDSNLELLINTLIVALFTNLINLLDLRPGRAIKFYLFFGILFILFGLPEITQIILFCIFGFCIAYLPQDLKAKSMMGDTGSNSLGINLGIICILSFSMKIKFCLLLFLLIIHLISEKYSLSAIIQNNSILNFIDQLGRN